MTTAISSSKRRPIIETYSDNFEHMRLLNYHIYGWGVRVCEHLSQKTKFIS